MLTPDTLCYLAANRNREKTYLSLHSLNILKSLSASLSLEYKDKKRYLKNKKIEKTETEKKEIYRRILLKDNRFSPNSQYSQSHVTLV